MCEVVDAHLEWMSDPKQGFAESTIRDRRKILAHLDRALPRGCCDVYADELDAFLGSPDWLPWTSHTYDSHLRGFYRWAAKFQWLSADPMPDVPRRPAGVCRPKPITPADLKTIFASSPEPWYGASMLALGAGLRASEIAAIIRRDITPEYVHVRCGKGGKERYVDTCASLWAYIAPLPPGPILRRPYGRVVTGPYLSSQQHAHWISIGLPHVHLHRLRHTFCTVMFQAGHQALVIKELMGHESLATTQGYALPAQAQRKQAVSAIDALLDGYRAGPSRPVPLPPHPHV